MSAINQKGPLWDSLPRADFGRRMENREDDGWRDYLSSWSDVLFWLEEHRFISFQRGRGGVLSARPLAIDGA